MTRVAQRILLVGAGHTGRIVATEYARQARPDVLVGFLDDDASLRGTRVAAVPVLGPVALLAEIAAAERVDQVVITIPSATGTRLREIVDRCRAAGVDVRTMPGILELLGERITPRQLRPVELGDLLRRSQVRCDQQPPGYLRGQDVLVTGAGGSIGRELARQVLRAGPASISLLGHGENSIHDVFSQIERHTGTDVRPIIADIRDRETMRRLFQRHQPSVVVHAAAHKHVPLMEAHPVEAVRNNVLGTRNVLDAACEAGVSRLVFVSSDKAVAPAGVMGATKRVGEWLVSSAGAAPGRTFLTVRFGNVLGSRGSVVPVLERQLARGEPMTLTHPDMRRFFMTIPEAAFLVLQAGGIASHGDLVVLDMGEPIRIIDLAHDLIRLAGADVSNVEIVFGGLRPGEKLVEALWEPDSRLTAIGDGLLHVVQPAHLTPSSADVFRLVEDLERAVDAEDDDRVREVLADAVASDRRWRPAAQAPGVQDRM